MALIEVFHVVASEMPINANATTNIPQGSIVSLDSSGLVVLHNGDSTTAFAVGIAGDSLSTGVTDFNPESGASLSRNSTVSLTGALVIGSGSQRFTQNQVANEFNEVLASGKMTVYHSGGEFWTDQYEVIHSNGTTVSAFTPAQQLFSSGAETAGGSALGEPESAQVGRFTDESASGAGTTVLPGNQICGITLTNPTAYPSGVPGTTVAFQSQLGGGEGGNSLSFGTFLHVKLRL